MPDCCVEFRGADDFGYAFGILLQRSLNDRLAVERRAGFVDAGAAFPEENFIGNVILGNDLVPAYAEYRIDAAVTLLELHPLLPFVYFPEADDNLAKTRLVLLPSAARDAFDERKLPPNTRSIYAILLNIVGARLRRLAETTHRVTALAVAHATFAVVSPSLPATPDAGNAVPVTVEFAPTDTALAVSTLIAHAEPCDVLLEIPLLGRVTAPAATVSFPVMEAPIDTTVAVPLRLEHASQLEGVGTTPFDVRVVFNRSVLLPVGVRADRSDASAVVLSNTADGSVCTLDIRVNDAAQPAEGSIL